VVFPGLSGSGKSSLAFDTIFAEGQRRYVESLSSYARQFLGQMDKPDVDFIEGLSPAVSIDQKSTSRNPRSTVGTITEIYDYLRLLYARIGHPHCPICGEPISKQTPQQIVDRVLEMPEGTRFQVLAPVIRERKGEYTDLMVELQAKGYSRVRIDGVVYQLTDPPKLKKQEKHSIEVVVDRLVIRATAKQRITDSVETGLRLADGVVILDFVDLDEDDPLRERRYSERLACPNDHPLALDELEPRSFSFNSPFGACPECTGLGTRKEVDPELVVPDGAASLGGGAIHPWSAGTTSEYFARLLQGLAEVMGFSMDTSWDKLPPHVRKAVLHGVDEQVHVTYRNRYNRQRSYYAEFEGVIPYLERRAQQTDSDFARDKYEGYMREVPCPSCHGTRLKPEILAVTIEHAELGRQNIAELSAMSIKDAAAFFPGLVLSQRDRMIAERVLKEVDARLGFLLDVGLDYLSLNRPAATLSGGEAQRIRLATQIGSGLVGVLYVLDEPSIGLHQRDNHRLIQTLTRLRDLGNTLIVVEHDEDTIRTADWVVDIGPGAGEHGGQIVVSGTVKDLLAKYDTLAFDPKKGDALLSAKGFKKDSAGAWTDPQGKKLTLDIIGFGASGPAMGPVLSEMLRRRGVEAALSLPPDFDDRFQKGQFVGSIYGHGGAINEPYSMLRLYQGRSVAVPGAHLVNFARWKNAEFDKITDEMYATDPDDKPKMLALFHRAMEIWLPELPDIQLVQNFHRIPMNTTYWKNWPTADNNYVNGASWHLTYPIVLWNLQPA